MKIKIISSFGVFGGSALWPGDILDPPTEIALDWIRLGLAKPFGVTPETPSLVSSENTSTPVLTSRHKAKRNR